MALKHLVDELMLAQHGRLAVEELNKENFQKWDKSFIFEAIKDQRYGQAFCNHFGITDNILYYTRDMDRCRQLIRKNYLKCIG